jgi:S-(hydroxymethyl)glutathione dehydrogenase/alcohol dehydrogenase
VLVSITAVRVHQDRSEYDDCILLFGKTADFINPTKLPEGVSVVDKVVALTDGGADYTFDATGNVGVMRSALEACHKGQFSF